MYPNNFMSKPTFMTNSSSSGYGSTTSSFGQPATNTPIFSGMQPSNIFQTPSTSSFNAGPAVQSSFGSNLFGQQQQQPSTSGLFGSSNAFGQNKTTFGTFGSTPAQSGLFGQQPQQQAGTTLFQSNTSNLFGSSGFGNQQTTGTVIKFSPVTGTDTMQKNGVTNSINTKHHCITCMKEYENKSFEELRFEDYSCNRKGPQQQPGFSSTPFGATAPGPTNTLFGQTDNKQGFGQTPGFGQTSTFGQTTPGFGTTNPTNTPSLFGKPNFGVVTSSTPSFGFNATPSTSNPFSASQAAKPFSQPLFGTTTTQAQNTFGTGVFGQNTNQNPTTNLFQKPAQPTTGFNTGQPGFSFNQTTTTQAPNLFQVSKPNTGFGIFGQTNTAPAFGQTSQPAFGTNFGKLTTSSFAQPTQPSFTGLPPQQPLFGNTSNKSQTLFGNTGTGVMFNNNMFPQAPNNFSLNMNQQQPTQFPPEPNDDSKNISLILTDLFPDGPQFYGLDPVVTEAKNSATNPQDLKALLQSTRKREELLGARSKLKVHIPKPKRGTHFKQDFFETNQILKNSPKCLVIRKFNDSNTTIFNKYNNEILEEAEKCLKQEMEEKEARESDRILTSDSETVDFNTIDMEEQPSFDGKEFAKNVALRLKFGTYSDETKSESKSSQSFAFDESTFDNASPTSSKMSLNSTSKKSSPRLIITHEESLETIGDADQEANSDPANNPAGVILTRPEYYIYPALKDLQQYMDENGQCVVQGLTIGRKGYGNVYFPDHVNITNINLDEIVHFRHREIIIYPDEENKPPLGEGLNRRAQVTLDKIYPREKGTNKYITDVNEIVNSNFVANLMEVTLKHDCKFVDYRPKTGSWVFKVKHFSKYCFTDSDDDICELYMGKQEILKTNPEEYSLMSPPSGLGGVTKKSGTSPYASTISLIYDQPQSFTSSWQLRDDQSLPPLNASWKMRDRPGEFGDADFSTQTLKSSLFSKFGGESFKVAEEAIMIPKPEYPSEVISKPRVFQLPDLSLAAGAEDASTTQRCYTDLSIFRDNNFRVGWGAGFTFYNSDMSTETEVVYALDRCSVETARGDCYNAMMPNLESILKTTMKESKLHLDEQEIPTLRIENALSYLGKLTDLFENHAKDEMLKGRMKYLNSIWNLCTALWGEGDASLCGRRQSLSDWLRKFTFELQEDWSPNEFIEEMTENTAFQTIFNLLSFHKVSDACKFATKNNLPELTLLISQLSANERYKKWLQKDIETFGWREKGVILDDFKKIYLLLSGVLAHSQINICENLEWLRAFALHLWYIAPSASPITTAFNLFKKAVKENFGLVSKPKPHYCDSDDGSAQNLDLLYQILALYVNGSYPLSNVLDPETHTDDIMDYRLSWFLAQLFFSLKVGLISDLEKEYLHTTFASQLENLGEWKWAIFVLLFLENNAVKKNLIMKILERNVELSPKTSKVERELVETFKIPPMWIHEVKAVKAKLANRFYEYFEHCVHIKDWHGANKILVDEVLPELFLNEQYDEILNQVSKIEQESHNLINWHTQAGVLVDFLAIRKKLIIEHDITANPVGQKICFLIRRIASFPTKTDNQKLCVTELYRRCIYMAKMVFDKFNDATGKNSFVIDLQSIAIPVEIKHYETYQMICKKKIFS